MLSEPYWQRTWIYQEATTSRPTHVFYGAHSAPIEFFDTVIYFGMKYGRLPEFDNRFRVAAGPNGPAFKLLAARLERKDEEHQRLIELMASIRATDCSDPRDKVYAPLGHASDEHASQISFDYKRDIVDLYIDVAQSALFNSEMMAFEILGLVFRPVEEALAPRLSRTYEPPMPSWVPDWRSMIGNARLVNYPRIRPDSSAVYNPCPGTTMRASLHNRELEVRGHVAESLEIATLTSIYDGIDQSKQVFGEWYHTLKAQDPFSASLEEAICRSLVGDKAYVLDSSGVFSWERGSMVDWKLLQSDRDKLDQSSLKTYDSMLTSVFSMCGARRMARFSDGRVGILPAAAKIGDKIAVFNGGFCLYLLRPIPDRRDAYAFVGECYVDGLMDGAFLEVCRPEGQSARSLRLV